MNSSKKRMINGMVNFSFELNRYLDKIIYAVMCMYVLTSCTEEDPVIGSEFFRESSVELISWDTLTMEMSTVQIEEMVTSDASRLLVGQSSKEYVGVTSAETYFKLGDSLSAGGLFDGNYEFSRATLKLYYDGYYNGDTTKYMGLEVYMLSEELELDDETDELYNYSSFSTIQDEEGSSIIYCSDSIKPRQSEGFIELEIDEEKGLEIFDFLNEEGVESTDFQRFLKGFKMVATSAECIIGFQTDVNLLVYYTDTDEQDDTEQLIQYSLSSKDVYFNHVEVSRLDSQLENLNEEDRVSSDDTGDKSFIHGGMGLALRLDFPSVSAITSEDDKLLLDKVEIGLIIENDLPEEQAMIHNLIAYSVDEDNDVKGIYNDISVTASLFSEFGSERKYILDITSFIEDLIEIDSNEEGPGLLLLFEENEFDHTVDHVVIADQKNEDNESTTILNIVKIKQ